MQMCVLSFNGVNERDTEKSPLQMKHGHLSLSLSLKATCSSCREPFSLEIGWRRFEVGVCFWSRGILIGLLPFFIPCIVSAAAALCVRCSDRKSLFARLQPIWIRLFARFWRLIFARRKSEECVGFP